MESTKEKSKVRKIIYFFMYSKWILNIRKKKEAALKYRQLLFLIKITGRKWNEDEKEKK